MDLNHAAEMMHNFLRSASRRGPGLGKAVAFAIPLVIFVMIVTALMGNEGKHGGSSTTSAGIPQAIPSLASGQATRTVQSAASGPPPAVAAAYTATALGTMPTPVPVAGTATYTVMAGDTPLAIAESLGIPAAERAEWIQLFLRLNHTSATALQVGQVLNLPVQPGSNPVIGVLPVTKTPG